jgi:hypothetical protein
VSFQTEGSFAATAAAGSPRMLLFALQTSHASSCRWPKAFGEAGFVVAALCGRSSLLRSSQYLRQAYPLHARRLAPVVLHDLKAAFRQFQPDLIVPCDERAVQILAYFLRREQAAPRFLPPALLSCLRVSLGRLETFPDRSMKDATYAVARRAGVAIPESMPVAAEADITNAGRAFGYPFVLRRSHGASGDEVRICRDHAHAVAAFSRFASRPALLKTALRRMLRSDWFPQFSAILAQRYIAGLPGMTCAAAVEGRTAAIVTAITVQQKHETGPATVASLAPHPGMAEASGAMIAAFGASGLISFDFALDEAGNAFLLECNARPTYILHLGPLAGVDLAHGFFEGVNGRMPPASQFNSAIARTVSFFPESLALEPRSGIAGTGTHDVPWDDPVLLRAILRKAGFRGAEAEALLHHIGGASAPAVTGVTA